MTGIIATFRYNGETNKLMKGVLTTVTAKKGTNFYEDKCDQINTYFKDKDLDPIGVFITTDESIFYRKRLEARVEELKTYTEYHKYYMDYCKNKLKLEKAALELTDKTLSDHEETLMKTIALRVRSCMVRDIEVRDELALKCFDWYEEMRK